MTDCEKERGRRKRGGGRKKSGEERGEGRRKREEGREKRKESGIEEKSTKKENETIDAKVQDDQLTQNMTFNIQTLTLSEQTKEKHVYEDEKSEGHRSQP